MGAVELRWTPASYGPALLPVAGESQKGLRRWSALLPIDESDAYPLEVGNTPLVRADRLAERAGLGPGRVFLKDETRSPTGSNKDRATALCITDAIRLGAPAVAAASSGNVAVSLAAGAAAAGVPAYLFVAAAAVAPSKVALMRGLGAHVLLVDGSYEDAYRLSEAACRELGWYSRNTGQNPLAFQAKKTVAFEVWEQLGRRFPDRVYIPVGDGVTLAAFAHGCAELIRCGVASRMPQMIGVQAMGSAPLANAFSAGADTWRPVQPATIADGIAMGDPFFGSEALSAVRATDGAMIAISDDRIREAIDLLASTVGLVAEPAGAAALGGWLEDGPSADAGGSSTTVILVTGSGLKDHRWLPRLSGHSTAIGPSLDALVAALKR